MNTLRSSCVPRAGREAGAGGPAVETPAQAYPFSAYDRNLCLKMSVGMWAVLAFLLRPYVIVMASITNKTDRIGIIDTFYPDKGFLAIGALTAIPAMVIIYAWIMRQKAVQGLPRKIWQRGREIMLGLLGLNVIALLGPAVSSGVRPTIGVVLQLAGCAACLWYLSRSDRVADAFADYPDTGGD